MRYFNNRKPQEGQTNDQNINNTREPGQQSNAATGPRPAMSARPGNPNPQRQNPGRRNPGNRSQRQPNDQRGPRSNGPRGGRMPARNFRSGRPGRGNRTGQSMQNNLYPTANALNWANNGSYQYSTTDTTEKLRVIPVSGVEMVGTNCTVFEYGEDIVIVDAGQGFPDEELTGIDALVPNLSFLDDRKQNIRGIVITHGHTDHIGGIPYIIEKAGFPMIYAPRLAAELIREKLKEFSLVDKVKITEIDGSSAYYLGKFHISHFKMNHTIPDNFGIVLNTPVGRVVTTSDYKFDSSPYKESPSDYSKLCKLGDEGVLLLLDESTNAKKRGWADSETDIAKDIEDIIRTANGRVLIGMFSTMVNRMRQVVEMAAKYNKKVAVLGRSLEAMVKINHNLGYIDVVNSVFVGADQIGRIPDNQLVILTTGSQGEPNAALMRMALSEHSKVTLKTSDTVVFSSSRIPGNEGKIDHLINLLTLKGVTILTNDYLTIHSTGHGHQEDHKLMLRLVKPKFFMPIHGEPSMLRAHKDTAMGLGYAEQNIIMSRNGMIIEVWNEGWKHAGDLDTTSLWVEGNRVGDFDAHLIQDRKILADEGVIVITVKNFDQTTFGLNDIEIIHKGFFIQNKDDFFSRKLPYVVQEVVNGQNVQDRNKESLRSSIKRQTENELKRQYDKQPLVVVSVL